MPAMNAADAHRHAILKGLLERTSRVRDETFADHRQEPANGAWWALGEAVTALEKAVWQYDREQRELAAASSK